MNIRILNGIDYIYYSFEADTYFILNRNNVYVFIENKTSFRMYNIIGIRKLIKGKSIIKVGRL